MRDETADQHHRMDARAFSPVDAEHWLRPGRVRVGFRQRRADQDRTSGFKDGGAGVLRGADDQRV